jgi:hypothetical protein
LTEHQHTFQSPKNDNENSMFQISFPMSQKRPYLKGRSISRPIIALIFTFPFTFFGISAAILMHYHFQTGKKILFFIFFRLFLMDVDLSKALLRQVKAKKVARVVDDGLFSFFSTVEARSLDEVDSRPMRSSSSTSTRARSVESQDGESDEISKSSDRRRKRELDQQNEVDGERSRKKKKIISSHNDDDDNKKDFAEPGSKKNVETEEEEEEETVRDPEEEHQKQVEKDGRTVFVGNLPIEHGIDNLTKAIQKALLCCSLCILTRFFVFYLSGITETISFLWKD